MQAHVDFNHGIAWIMNGEKTIRERWIALKSGFEFSDNEIKEEINKVIAHKQSYNY